jgi:hypothetical protein
MIGPKDWQHDIERDVTQQEHDAAVTHRNDSDVGGGRDGEDE